MLEPHSDNEVFGGIIFSGHARKRMQGRSRLRELRLVLDNADLSEAAGHGREALRLSHRMAERLREEGHAPDVVARALRLVPILADGQVLVTVLKAGRLHLTRRN